MSQGREPEGSGLSFPTRAAGSGGGQACAARQRGRAAAAPPFAPASSVPSRAGFPQEQGTRSRTPAETAPREDPKERAGRMRSGCQGLAPQRGGAESAAGKALQALRCAAAGRAAGGRESAGRVAGPRGEGRVPAALPGLPPLSQAGAARFPPDLREARPAPDGDPPGLALAHSSGAAREPPPCQVPERQRRARCPVGG